MGKTITNPDGSRTRVSSSGRKFTYPIYGEGGNTKPHKQPSAEASKSFMDDWSGVTTTKDIKPTVTQAKADIPQKDINEEPLYIKPWNWNKPATGKIEESVSPIDLIGTGIVSGAAKLGTKALQNTHKINPWAFKPNPEMGYRMLGREGFQDAVETGVLRAKPIPNQAPSGGISLSRNTNRNPNTGKMQGALDRPYFADGVVDERYAADYMAAVNKAENNLVPIATHKGIAPPQAGSIPLENATLYKKDWLKGYKELSKKQWGGKIKKSYC